MLEIEARELVVPARGARSGELRPQFCLSISYKGVEIHA